ncbi:MAG TPA: choice-of-anchor P family protein [Candidatus Saccharimonadia bacterium]|nr:choice-of-anchor P family protein [Candidatus Saccharimonadia bacterium]
MRRSDALARRDGFGVLGTGHGVRSRTARTSAGTHRRSRAATARRPIPRWLHVNVTAAAAACGWIPPRRASAFRATLARMTTRVRQFRLVHAAMLAAFCACASPAFGATQAQGDAAGVSVWVRGGNGGALDTGALPSGASGFAPLDYEVTTVALDSNVTLGSLATLTAGPLSAGVRATLARELSEASAGAQSLDVRIGGASGILLYVGGAASTAFAHCRDGTRRVDRDAVLEDVLLTVRGQAIALVANPPPNTRVPLPLAGASLVLNEQTTVDGVESVNAMRLTLDDATLGNAQMPLVVDGEIVVAHSAVSLAPCGTYIDSDADGLLDSTDNCPAVPNPFQRDTDADGGGDACDVDDDADLLIDTLDSCPLEANPAQGACPNAVFLDGFEG